MNALFHGIVDPIESLILLLDEIDGDGEHEPDGASPTWSRRLAPTPT